ncbi:MAG: hypothetical protein WD557_10285 [Dehalococcoidia bacterium]
MPKSDEQLEFTRQQRRKLAAALERVHRAAANANGDDLRRLNLEAAGLASVLSDLDCELENAPRDVITSKRLL